MLNPDGCWKIPFQHLFPFYFNYCRKVSVDVLPNCTFQDLMAFSPLTLWFSCSLANFERLQFAWEPALLVSQHRQTGCPVLSRRLTRFWTIPAALSASGCCQTWSLSWFHRFTINFDAAAVMQTAGILISAQSWNIGHFHTRTFIHLLLLNGE